MTRPGIPRPRRATERPRSALARGRDAMGDPNQLVDRVTMMLRLSNLVLETFYCSFFVCHLKFYLHRFECAVGPFFLLDFTRGFGRFNR